MEKKVKTPHQGMPSLDETGKPLSFFEFWPMWAFYPPIFLYVLWLMVRYRGIFLPTVANPSFPGGGFVGESKAQILRLAVQHIPEWTADFIALKKPPIVSSETELAKFKKSVLQHLDDAGLSIPLVAKPDIGCRGAGVKLLQDKKSLREYLKSFPSGEQFLLQRLADFEGEAGVFYCRHPDECHGRIISITLKYFPHVTGDGKSTLRELIMSDPRARKLSHLYLPRHTVHLDKVLPAGDAFKLAFAGSHSRGAIFRDGTALVTPAMEACFDNISKRLPEFYFGRYDIRFADFADVQAGKGFTIVEINGAGAESTHIWDRKMSLFKAWKDLMNQYKLLFQIGKKNRERGFRTLTWSEFHSWRRREKALTTRYPNTD
ncbi:hypothetical protein ACO0K7_15945 [Undibacterium sp. Ji67W]|uniref:hypothetical protein n=1 Tax=Undibacterium sp. Ji67W TaxID=3413042 RepID=UPI003BF20565